MGAVTLKEKAYEELRGRIMRGQLGPEDILTEQALVELLQMSRTPIRAALERLEAEGFIQYTANKGFQISEISLGRASDLFDFRTALECHVVFKLSHRVWDPAELDEVKRNLERQRSYAEANDPFSFTEADYEFHRLLAASYGNKEILQTMERLQDKLFTVALKVLRKDPARIRPSYEDHVRIFEAIERGQGEEASSLMTQHLNYGKSILIG